MDYSRLSQEGIHHRFTAKFGSQLLFDSGRSSNQNLVLMFDSTDIKLRPCFFFNFRTPSKAVINNTKKIKKNNNEIEKLKSENGDLQKPLEANKRLTKQTLEFLKKISELPSPDNPHDIKIRKTQNEKIGKGFKEAKTAFEQLDVNVR